MPNAFDNQSSAQLADDFGALKAQADDLKEKLDALKDELLARGERRVEGARFTLTIAPQSSTRLDTKALKQALGESICADFEKTTESMVVRVKPTAIFGQAA